MRSFGWMALCGTLLLAAGCGGESRSNVVNEVNNQLSDANSKIKVIKDKLKEATDKGDNKAPSEKELKEALDTVKELSGVPQALQLVMVKASRRAALTEEEKKEARRRGATNLNETLKELNASVRELEGQLADSKKKYGDKIQGFTEKVETAMNDFRNLGAQTK